MRGSALAILLGLAAGYVRAANFSDVLPGSRAQAMGSAFTAVADDPYAMFYNPAGTANTPYMQAGTSIGRMESPIGSLSLATLTYLRPYEPINTATVGAAYYLERQTNGGSRDELMFNYAREYRVPQLFLSQPLKVGGNFKFINVSKPNQSSAFGMGFDGGVLARGNNGWRMGISLLDLTSNVGIAHPVLSLGTAYTWAKWLTVSGDFRIHSGLAEYYPGIEASLYQGLLKLRAGKGVPLDGVNRLAFGAGINFSPAIIDVAMLIPTGGLHRSGGGYKISFNYRFGAPSFTGNFLGQSAGQAELLRGELQQREEEKKNIAAELEALKTSRTATTGQLKVLEQRVREVTDEYRLLLKQRDEAAYALDDLKSQIAPPPKPKPKPRPRLPAPPVWPRTHVVKDDDTLRSLAAFYYGDANLWEQIYDANRDKVDRGLPQIGTVLTIPAPAR